MSPRSAVLEEIQRSSQRPTNLLSALGPDYSYSEIQEALSDLLEKGAVVLTSGLMLEVAPQEGTKKEA